MRDAKWFLQQAQEFVSTHPGYFPCPKNVSALDAYLEEHDLEESSGNLARAYEALFFAGKLIDGERRERRAKPVADLPMLTLDDIIPRPLPNEVDEFNDLPDETINSLYRNAVQMRAAQKKRRLKQRRGEML